jgi:hypothetical protein
LRVIFFNNAFNSDPTKFFLLQCWLQQVNSDFNSDFQKKFTIEYWSQQAQKTSSSTTSIYCKQESLMLFPLFACPPLKNGILFQCAVHTLVGPCAKKHFIHAVSPGLEFFFFSITSYFTFNFLLHYFHNFTSNPTTPTEKIK